MIGDFIGKKNIKGMCFEEKEKTEEKILYDSNKSLDFKKFVLVVGLLIKNLNSSWSKVVYIINREFKVNFFIKGDLCFYDNIK